MEILVCMKQVPDDSIEIKLGADGQPDLSKAEPQGNAFDTYTQELAVRYIEANGGTVSILSLGPADNETCLKSALAVGAEKAYRVDDAGFEDAEDRIDLVSADVTGVEGVELDVVLAPACLDFGQILGEVAESVVFESAGVSGKHRRGQNDRFDPAGGNHRQRHGYRALPETGNILNSQKFASHGQISPESG